MKNLAIIPARSGSKGLAGKNIKLLDGKPLLAYTIEAAITSNQFDEVMVSTDSKEYAKIAEAYGASVPFLRTAENADDTASSWDVVKEVLSNYEASGKKFNNVALLQPTSPLRTKEDIIKGFETMTSKDANFVVSVCEMEHSPLWANTLPEDNSMKNFINSDVYKLPRQGIPTYFRLNGAFYLVKVPHLLKSENLYDESSYAFLMDRLHSVDVDDYVDFLIAETLLTKYFKE